MTAIQTFLTTWSFEPLVVISVLASALLYILGVRYTSRLGIGPRLQWWQITCFFLGLAVVFIALESEVDSGACQFLWVHMVQHDLLLMIAPPLLLFGIPTWIIWRAFPASWRRGVLLVALRYRWPWRFGQTVGRLASRPLLIWGIFVGDFLIWHIPFFYDLTLYHENIHIMEHLLFIGTALLFWAQVIPTHPQRRPAKQGKLARITAQPKHNARRLSYPQQALYLAAAVLIMNILGAIFVFSTGPIYQYYATLVRTPGMPSVVVDQHYAGAAMDVPGTFVFFFALMIVLGLWLREDEQEGQAEAEIGKAGIARS